MAEMTDNEALSILNKMEVEQRTLNQLWGQFTVAIRRVGDVIQKYQEVSKLLPDLESQRSHLEDAIGRLQPDLEARKRSIEAEEAKFRATLEAELEPLRLSVSEARERAAAASRDLSQIEKQALARKATLDQEIAGKQKELDNVASAFEQFKKQHGL